MLNQAQVWSTFGLGMYVFACKFTALYEVFDAIQAMFFFWRSCCIDNFSRRYLFDPESICQFYCSVSRKQIELNRIS